MTDSAIICQDVSFQYESGVPVLEKISMEISQGESVGLIGANGVGKSTLLRILTGLELEFSGRAFVASFSVQKKNLPQIRKRAGYVFQNSENQLFMQTVYEDLAFAPRNYGLPEIEVEKRVMEALEEIGITALKDKRIYQMSGGEKKMAAIASVLSMRPDIIFMDEPTIALDPKNRRRLIEVLNNLSQTRLIASHDLDMVLDTCKRVILMGKGRIVADGTAEEILYNEKILEKNGLELPLCLGKR